jgi:hypothetical protein
MSDTYTPSAEDVAAVFAGSIAFGSGTAAAVAAEIGKITGTDADGHSVKGLAALGAQAPDDAGRAIAAAVTRATKGPDDDTGLLVSIDTCLAALSLLSARAALAGHQRGSGSDSQPAAPAAKPAAKSTARKRK